VVDVHIPSLAEDSDPQPSATGAPLYGLGNEPRVAAPLPPPAAVSSSSDAAALNSNAAQSDGVAACQRRTTGGSVCVIPFEYDGLIQHDCVAWSESMSMYWCPIKGQAFQTVEKTLALAGNARPGGGLPDESWGWCEKGCWSGPTRLPTNVPTGLPSHNVTASPSSAPSVAKPAAEPAEAAPVEAVQPDKPRSADCARQTVQGKICQLPMLYKGKKYDNCMRYSNEVDMYWCITSIPETTNKTAATAFEWGWCMEGCAPDPTALSTIKKLPINPTKSMPTIQVAKHPAAPNKTPKAEPPKQLPTPPVIEQASSSSSSSSSEAASPVIEQASSSSSSSAS